MVKQKLLLAAGFVGGDWTFQLTQIQADRLLHDSLFSWSELGLMLGGRQSFLTSFPVHLFLKFLSFLGITAYSQILVLLFFLLATSCMYIFLRFLKVSRFFSFFGAVFYALTPIVFNYLLMGWIFVLLAYALFPLFSLLFIKSVREKNLTLAVAAGLLYSLALLQSQSLVWFPMIMLTLSLTLIKNRESFFSYLKAFLVVISLFLLLHSHWWPSLALVQDPGIAGGELVLSSVSKGTSLRLSFLNLIRAWGSLYNYQFESAYQSNLSFFTFIPPMLLLLALLFGIRKRLIFSLSLLALIPLILFLTPREIITLIPYSNLIRDSARFTVLSTFAYVVISVIFLDWLSQKTWLKQKKKLLALLSLLFLLFYTKPFWDDSFFSEATAGYDFRYRGYNFPQGFVEAEAILAEETNPTRALFLPLGGTYGMLDDKRFKGSFKGIRDLFAGYSPVPGVIWFSDRKFPVGGELISSLQEAVDKGNTRLVAALSRLIGTKYFVFRHNTWPEANTLLDLEAEFRKTEVENLLETSEVSLYQTNSYLPYVYIPDRIIALGGNYGNLADAVSFEEMDKNLDRKPVFLKVSEVDKAEKIITTPKKVSPILNEPIKWNKGWAWPSEPRVEPTSPKYPLMRIKEMLVERKNKNPLEKADVLIWHASKRISEENKWGQYDIPFFGTGVNEYLKDLDEAFTLLKSLVIADPDETTLVEGINKEDYFGMVVKVLAYSLQAEENTSTADERKLISEANNNFKTWLDKTFYGWCPIEDYCYETDIPASGTYTLYAQNSSLEGRNESLQLQLLGGKRLETLEKEEKGGFIPIANIDYEKESGQRLILTLENTPNLAERRELRIETKKLLDVSAKEGGETKDQEERTDQIYFLDSLNKVAIKNVEPNQVYKISFDYKTTNGPLRLTLFERQFDYEKLLDWGADYQTSKDDEVFIATVKVLDNKISNTFTDYEEYEENNGWEKYELDFKVHPQSKGAELYFQAIPSEETISNAEVRNLTVRKPLKPKLILVKSQEIAKTNKPEIAYEKINPTKYNFTVKDAVDPYLLVFNESFHDGWRLYRTEDLKNPIKHLFAKEVPANHYLVNGFANGYYLNPNTTGGDPNVDLTVEFWPQRLTYLGLFISGTTLLLSLLYLLRQKFIKR